MSNFPTLQGERRKAKKLDVFFQAGNTSFRDARNRCSRAVRNLNETPNNAPATRRVAAWKRITNPEDMRAATCPKEAFTAEIAFHNPSIIPSAPLIKAPIHLDYGLRELYHLGYAVADVRIGDDVNIGPNVTIISVGHSHGVDENGKRLSNGSDVTIGDCAWIGARATILPGLEIGSHSIIGAGSLVTRDVPAYHVVHGNPARGQRKIRDEVVKEPEDIVTSLEDALRS